MLHAVNITVMATEWTKHTVQVPASISTFKVSHSILVFLEQVVHFRNLTVLLVRMHLPLRSVFGDVLLS